MTAAAHGDPALVAAWAGIERRYESRAAAASRHLRTLGVKGEHPDDGWVDRQAHLVYFAYPRFNYGVGVGDLIALGCHWLGYRLVRVTAITEWGYSARRLNYHFDPEPHLTINPQDL